MVVVLFTREWRWILASVFMRFSGSLSLTGSVIIIYMILSDRRVKLKRIRNRFLLGMSIIEILSSASWIVSVSAAPEGTIGSYGAAGNQATCTLQGFLFQLGVGVPFYNLSLCLYHCLVICFNISDTTISKRLEPCLHALSILFPLSIALAGIPLKLYNFKGAICYIESAPWQCRYSSETPSCTRNPDSFLFEFWFAGFWILLIGCSVVVLMSLVYCSVRHRERKMSQFNFRTRDGTVVLSSSYVQLCKDKRETGIQAFLYVSAFVITYIWAGINYFISVGHKFPSESFRLVLFFFQPLQGFWTFFIYIRPRFHLISNQYNDKSFREKLILVIFYPDTGRRSSSMRVSPRSSDRINTSRSVRISLNDINQTARHPIGKGIENSADMNEDQYSGQNNIRASVQESRTPLKYDENDVDSPLSHPDSGDTSIKHYYIRDSASESLMPNSQRKESYEDTDNHLSLCIIPKDKSELVGAGRAFLSADSMTPMDGETRRCMSRVTIPLNEMNDDVVDDRNEYSQEDGQGKYPSQRRRRRRSLISIAPEDKVLVVDDKMLHYLESQKDPQRRRSLISISLDNLNDLVLDNQDDF